MQAQVKRHIRSGDEFSHLIPQPISKDTVVVGSGKAQLKDTLNLMKQMIQETLSDTTLLSKKLKGNKVLDTCRNIWQFIYGHIQYKMDKTGIEQVRRPSRTWADRMSGVDCDCYTVFIGSILSNLGIPYTMRITKYGGKKHFQHIYPVVFVNGKQIVMDCVTDTFDHEVPYSEKKDICPNVTVMIQDISGLSGVDTIDISLDALEQPKIPLHQMIRPMAVSIPNLCRLEDTSKQPMTAKKGRVISPFRFQSAQELLDTKNRKQGLGVFNYLLISTISVVAGIGVIRLLTRK